MHGRKFRVYAEKCQERRLLSHSFGSSSMLNICVLKAGHHSYSPLTVCCLEQCLLRGRNKDYSPMFNGFEYFHKRWWETFPVDDVLCAVRSHFSHVYSVTPWTTALPGSSVHGILWARILEWVAIPFSRRSSWTRDQTWVSYVSCISKWFFTT